MYPLVTLALLTALNLDDPAPREEPPTRWLPRVTFRFTHRSAAFDLRALERDAWNIALGSTFEVRLEWGLSSDP
jgi:hypothetical protein